MQKKIESGDGNYSVVPDRRYCLKTHKWLTKENQKASTLLPWLDEYSNPYFFDPEGVLKTGVDLSKEIETPVLDFLREYAWEYASKEKVRSVINRSQEILKLRLGTKK